MREWDEVAIEVEGLVDKVGQPVDSGIKQLIIGLRCLGVPTAYSCEGHLDGTQAYPSVDVIAEDLPDDIYAKQESVDSLTQLIEMYPVVNQIREKNFAAFQTMIEILDQYYHDRNVSSGQRIVLIPWDDFGLFRMECQGSRLQEFRTEPEKKECLKIYQQEMNDLAYYLRDQIINKDK